MSLDALLQANRVEMVKIADVAKTTSGTTPSRDRKDYWEPPKYSWVKTGEIAFYPIHDTEEKVSEKAIQECSLPLLPPGTVLVAMYGQGKTRGQSAVLEVEATTNQACFAILPNDSFDPDYLQLWLRCSYERLRALSEGRGGNQANLNGEMLNAVEVPLIPNDEQRRIAARLKAQLAAVEEARQAAQAQVKEAEALFAAMLREIEITLLGSYKVTPFSQWVLSYRNGFGKRPKMGEKGPIVLRIADVSSGVINLDDPRQGEVSPKEAETYRLLPGDLLFVRVNGAREIVGRCCVVDKTLPTDTIFNDHLIRTQLREGLLPEFAQLCMSLPSARMVIEEAASTSAGQLTVNQQILDSVEIPYLPIDQQLTVIKQLGQKMGAVEQLRAAAQAQLQEIELLPSRLLAQAFEKESSLAAPAARNVYSQE
ncbi:MAG: restriction endonuclease subunit S [Acidobacteria bacterium]|nr:restriction endonuclease subunit S [Acidobacteriota bacterium]